MHRSLLSLVRLATEALPDTDPAEELCRQLLALLPGAPAARATKPMGAEVDAPRLGCGQEAVVIKYIHICIYIHIYIYIVVCICIYIYVRPRKSWVSANGGRSKFGFGALLEREDVWRADA